MAWKQHIEASWFREEDYAYAGKDHSKNNKTFICINGYDSEEMSGFKTLQAAMDYADKNWTSALSN